MFHPAYAQALAKERQTQLVKAAERHRSARTLTRAARARRSGRQA